MRLFGLDITRAKALVPTGSSSYAVGDRGQWWWPAVREPFTGAWQRNMEERPETLLSYHAVYACITLIASDIAKCRIKLVERDDDIWSEIENAAHSPVLRRPNEYQNRIQFFESWMTSKLVHGNTYVLKVRDARGLVIEMYVLDPLRTKTLVADDGSVFYELQRDNLAGIEYDGNVRVPARDVIHDMCTMRYHPLCGVPPMAPAALAATHGLNIQRGSITLFRNNARPGGVLSTPQNVSQEVADRIKMQWEEHFTGPNAGRLAVVGQDFKYTQMEQTAVEAQLIEQLGISAKMVCSAFQVPAYMAGVGDPPAYNNIEALNQQYYSQCLQKHFEAIELALDYGLGLTEVPGKVYGTEFDLDDLLRMDTATRIKTYSDAVKGGLFKPDEARKKFDLPAVDGGDEVYLQQQNFSLAALAKRDAKDDPFSSAAPTPPPGAGAPSSPPVPADGGSQAQDGQQTNEDLAAARQFAAWELRKQLDLLAA